MPVNPEISLKWGGGSWSGGHKKAIRPTVTEAISTAAEGLQHFGIQYERPKTIIVWQATRTFTAGGGCLDSVRSELYIPQIDVKHRKVARYLGILSGRVFHELIHNVRAELCGEGEHLSEIATSEGLAYCAEDIFIERFLPGMTGVGVRELAQEAEDDLWSLQAEFDAEAPIKNPLNSTDFQEWFLNNLVGVDISPGVFIGVSRIKHHLDNGAEIRDLLPIPAEQLLGITNAQTAA